MKASRANSTSSFPPRGTSSYDSCDAGRTADALRGDLWHATELNQTLSRLLSAFSLLQGRHDSQMHAELEQWREVVDKSSLHNQKSLLRNSACAVVQEPGNMASGGIWAAFDETQSMESTAFRTSTNGSQVLMSPVQEPSFAIFVISELISSIVLTLRVGTVTKV